MSDLNSKLELLSNRFPGSVVSVRLDGADICAEAEQSAVPALCEFLRDDPAFRCDYPADLFACDTGEHIVLRYRLYSTEQRLDVRVTVPLDREHPQVGSVVHVWPGMDWHERECYDLFGVVFHGHPDLPCPGHMRILLPEDWDGHPFRKDYTPVFAGDPLHGPQEPN